MPETPEPPRDPRDTASQAPTVQASTPGLSDPHSTLDSSASTSREQQPAQPKPSKFTPQAIGNYDLLEEIGRGAMGVVYKAREQYSGRIVALKMMLDRSGRGGNRSRFALEARATGRLSHPGIVTIHAWGEHSGQPFYTMDYVPGVLLSRMLEDGPLPCSRAVPCLIGIARAVAAAHRLGIVHRDLKPGNVMIDATGKPRVLDFGLAKRLSTPTGEPLHPSLDGAGSVMADSVVEVESADGNAPVARLISGTEHGAILGTPSYMAPEQARGDHASVGPATDVYALGTILYEMLTGRPPFQGGSVHEVLKKVCEREPPPLRSWGPRVPAAVEEVCRHAMAKHPSERYADAGQLADHLETRWRQCSLAPRFARLTALAAIALVVLAALWIATQVLRTRWANPSPPPIGASANQPYYVALTLVNAIALYGAGLLAWLSGLLWLGAWVWHASRPLWIVGGSILLAIAAGAFLLAPPFLREVAVLVPASASAVACGVWLRQRSASRRAEESADAARQPFLGRLIAASAHARRTVEARQDQLARTTGPVRVGFDDFEIGKTLHRWTGGKVQRGRQKSLNRPVLVWSEAESAAADEIPPVVLARDHGLLGLYAIGAGPEGRFLATEPAAGTPLVDHIGRITTPQILILVARLARIVATLHEQGACHARLTADWVLVHGDLEPTLCPNTIPCRSAEDCRRDLQALGELMAHMLSSVGATDTPAAAESGAAALAAAAKRGDYGSAVELADDLNRHAQILRQRWRAQLSTIVVAALTALPWLGLPALGERFALLLPAALAPACLLLGYTQARTLHLRYCLQQPLWRKSDLAKGLAPLLLLALPPALLAGHGPLAATFPDIPRSGLILAAELLTSWLAGALAAGLATAAEWVWLTLQTRREY